MLDEIATITLNGSAGADTLGSYGEQGEYYVYYYSEGLSGNDVIYGSGVLSETLLGNEGDDTIISGTGSTFDTLCGNEGNDYIIARGLITVVQGNQGDDTLIGGASLDNLHGGQGDDVLNGAGDNDNINGGKGNDTLTGGEGYDTFAYNPSTGGKDVVTDFNVSQDELYLMGVQNDENTLAGIIASAQHTSQGLLFDFGNGNQILLLGVTEDLRMGANIFGSE